MQIWTSYKKFEKCKMKNKDCGCYLEHLNAMDDLLTFKCSYSSRNYKKC